jgi:hypothetical protein
MFSKLESCMHGEDAPGTHPVLPRLLLSQPIPATVTKDPIELSGSPLDSVATGTLSPLPMDPPNLAELALSPT